MYGSIFQQQNNQSANAFAQPMGFAQNNGVVFGNTPQPVRSNLTNEQLDIIRKKNQNGLTLTADQLLIEEWNFRNPDGTLALEVIDPATNLVRVRGTNITFNMVVASKEVVEQMITFLTNAGMTAKATTKEYGDNVNEINKAIGIVRNLFPQYYNDAITNLKNDMKNSSNMVSGIGYQGNWNNGYFNGTIGAVPNYFIPNGNMGYQQPMPGAYQQPTQPQMMPQQMPYQQPMGYQQQPMQYPQQQMMGAPMPMGGTMMGGNPFVQNGQPQQQPQMTPQQSMTQPQAATPQLQNIPMPGAPVTPTANPAMGGQNNTTTATTKV